MSREALPQPQRPQVQPHWTLGQLKAQFPGVEMAMFAHFGVGSRERSGFSASETLEELLRRHLIFDAGRACARLDDLAGEDWAFEVNVVDTAQKMSEGKALLLDVRSSLEHQLCAPHGSLYLDGPTVAALKARIPERVVAICNDGCQAPAASRHLRSIGLNAFHVGGGVVAWSQFVDSRFPILYPLAEIPERWHLLADGNTLRYRHPAANSFPWRLWTVEELRRHKQFKTLTEEIPELTLLAISPRSFAARGPFRHLETVISRLVPWLQSDSPWGDGGSEPSAAEEKAQISKCLAEDAPKILQSHKGTVEIADYQDRVLTLRLGGGCAGCASAAVTTQRELAALLYQRVPLLDAIQSES